MKFQLNRNLVVSSLLGHTIAFEKGVLTHVPPEMYQDVISKGAIPETELDIEEAAPKAPAMSADERKEIVFAAFTTLVEKNERESFTGNGAPHNKAVQAITGFAVDAKERDALWAEFRQLHATKDA